MKVIDKTHLELLIDKHIIEYGPECSLNHLDVSAVNDFSCLFMNKNFNGDISKWQTSQVTNFSFLFAKSNFNGDLSNWNTSNVTDMSYMFSNSPFNQNISKWDLSSLNIFHSAFTFEHLSPLGMLCVLQQDVILKNSLWLNIYYSKIPIINSLNLSVKDAAHYLYETVLSETSTNHKELNPFNSF